MADEPDGEPKTIELVNETTGEQESYRVHDVVELDGETYYVLQAEKDPDRVMVLRREGEALVTLDDDERDRVIAELEDLEEEEEDLEDEDEADGAGGARSW